MTKLPSCEDYEISINNERLVKCCTLHGGHVEKNSLGTTINYVGGFCIVFPFYKSSGDKVAVRCWIARVEDAQERSKLIADELKRVNLPYFVNFEYEQNGIATNLGVQPIILMDWIEADSLKDYIQENISNSDVLRNLAYSFKTMVEDLHRVNISHGDLQHGNILVRNDGSLVLVDYDSMYVPALNGYKDEIKGLLGYQHPARWESDYVSEKNDYFSELIIYTSILALSYFPELWNELKIEDTETLLFSADDIKSGGNSYIFRKLDSHQQLKDLSATIKKELLCSSIDELLPLEEAIIPKTQRIGVGIRNKWNVKQAQTAEIYVPDTIKTRAKWNKK